MYLTNRRKATSKIVQHLLRNYFRFEEIERQSCQVRDGHEMSASANMLEVTLHVVQVGRY